MPRLVILSEEALTVGELFLQLIPPQAKLFSFQTDLPHAMGMNLAQYLGRLSINALNCFFLISLSQI